MNTKLADRVASALDMTHNAAAMKYGRLTDSARWTLATYLDGEKIRASYVLKLVRYLEMIGSYGRPQ